MSSAQAKPSPDVSVPSADAEGFPSAWAQAYPRGVALGGGGPLIPAATLRVLLRPGRTLPVRLVGHALIPWMDHGDEVDVDAGRAARPGDVVLCQIGRWAELRRVIRLNPEGSVSTALDVLPRLEEPISAGQVMGIVQGSRGAGDAIGRTIAAAFPVWSRCAALLYWWKKIATAPLRSDDGTATIRQKYDRQVDEYEKILDVPLGQWTLDLVGRHVPAGGTLLVPGSGAGREALHLARAGYRVVGVDLVQGMVETASRHAAARALSAEFICGDIATLDFGARRFDGVYFTPLVYSFIPGRSRRIATLRRLGDLLAPGGAVIYSAHLTRHWTELARLCAVTIRRRWNGDRRSEFGDWFTWFLSPDGEIATAFSHRFSVAAVRHEGTLAGFGLVEEAGDAHFVARAFRR